jgi:hypothetical protein
MLVAVVDQIDVVDVHQILLVDQVVEEEVDLDLDLLLRIMEKVKMVQLTLAEAEVVVKPFHLHQFVDHRVELDLVVVELWL